MKLRLSFDIGFWVIGFVVMDGFLNIMIGPFAIQFYRPPSMEDLQKAVAAQHADMLDELVQAGVVKQVSLVERIPRSEKVM